MATALPIILSGINQRQYNPASDLIPFQNYLNIVDQKTQNTAGGTFTAGAWRTRDLNTVRVNQVGASLASNEITLPAGKYICRWSAPAYSTSINDKNQTRLQNITAATTLLLGSVSRGASQGVSIGGGLITLAVSSILQLQHWTTSTRNTDGFGAPGNIAAEIYSQIEFLKLEN